MYNINTFLGGLKMNPFILLESAAADPAAAAGSGSMILMLVMMFAVFYFLIIRPENKKRKKTDEMRSSLSNGDQITTIGGITGKIVQITEDTITIETGEDRVRIQLKKWAVSTTAKMEAEEAAVQSKGFFKKG